jgi:Na+/proline symporter
MIAAVGTGKDERACRIGFFYGNYIKRFCTAGWALLGLMVAAMVVKGTFGATSLGDPEDAFGFACGHLLFSGARGLLIACVLAATMSTCSAFLVDCGALFTKGFYSKHLMPGKSDLHYLWVGRTSGLVITMVGVLYALFLVKVVLYSFLLTESLSTFMGICIVGGIIWRRANRWGALVSVSTALGVNFIMYAVQKQRFDYWDPAVFSFALTAGILSLVVVSLFTPPEPQSGVASFFARLQTPSDVYRPETETLSSSAHVENKDGMEWEGRSDQPSIEHAERGQQLLLVNLLNLRRATCGINFFRAYRVDLSGLAIGLSLALALVAVVWMLLRIQF